MWPWSSANSKSSDTITIATIAVDQPHIHSVPEGKAKLREEAAAIIAGLQGKATSLPPHLVLLSAFTLGSVSTAVSVYTYVKLFRRFPTAEWVNPRVLARKPWLKGYVTSVGDPDNFRIYHTPGFGWRRPFKFRHVPSTSKDLKDQTIHIRLAGVDAPEAGHFGRPAQPYAEEAGAWLKSQVEGKTVYCQLLRRDQYGRIVAMPYLRPRLLPGFLATGKCIPVEMLRAGWVQTYEQSGAEYGPWSREEFLQIQADAQTARRGIWKHGTDAESPAEYKRRWAADAKGSSATANQDANDASVKQQDKVPKRGWIRRVFNGLLRS